MGRRQIIEGHGLPKHPQPFPTAVKVGNVVCSSAVGGQDPTTGKAPDSPEAQIKNAFGHITTILKLAGGSPADVVKITVHLKDKAMRDLVNQEWIKMFPDEKDRPVRHTLTAPDLPGANIIQLEMMAVLEK